MQDAVARVGAVGARPNRALYTDKDLESVHNLLKRLGDRYEADGRVSEADKEAVRVRYGEMTGERDTPFAFAVSALMDFLASEDDYDAVTRMAHPFETIGDGLPATVLAWLKSYGVYACPSCGEHAHTSKTSGGKANKTDLFAEYNACLAETSETFCCCVCNQVFPISDSEAHVSACLRAGWNIAPG